jgi:hypothetical protein
MSQEDAVIFLHDQGLPAGAIHQRVVDLFGNAAIGYSTVTRTIQKVSWTASKTPKGRRTNLSVDAALLKVLNDDSTASVDEIAQEVKLSVSTVFDVLTTRMDTFIADANSCLIICLSRRKMIISGKVMNFWNSSKRQKAPPAVHPDGR